MKPDYKNWMPKGMIFGFAAGAAICALVVAFVSSLMADGNLKTVITLIADIGIIVFVFITIWCVSL